MPNRSHYNRGHRMMNYFQKTGWKHSSHREFFKPHMTIHAAVIKDPLELLREIPDNSIQLVICDPPYNLKVAPWDDYENYLGWASAWLNEIPRILLETGNFIIFGGLQFQDDKGGDLLTLLHYLRHNSSLRLVNLIIWHYKNGMSAHRFFANRHEEIAWFAKTKRYTFNLDDVRIPFDPETKKAYLRDRRLRPESIEKGKNPSNVWELPRLNANSKERVGHLTQKPRELIRRIVKALSLPGDIVLDPFAGSGVTLRVCIEEGRSSIISDIDLESKKFWKAQVEQLELNTLIPFTLLEDWRSHPVFSLQKAPLLIT